VASRLRANLEQQQKINSENKPSGMPLPNPFAQATNPLNGAPFMPFRLPFAGLPQTTSAAALNFNSPFAQQAQAQLSQQSPQPLSVIGQTRPADSNTLYQPAVKRRRRGYGSEVRKLVPLTCRTSGILNQRPEVVNFKEWLDIFAIIHHKATH